MVASLLLYHHDIPEPLVINLQFSSTQSCALDQCPDLYIYILYCPHPDVSSIILCFYTDLVTYQLYTILPVPAHNDIPSIFRVDRGNRWRSGEYLFTFREGDVQGWTPLDGVGTQYIILHTYVGVGPQNRGNIHGVFD